MQIGAIAPWHWVTLAAIIGVLFVAPKRLPGLGRALGQAVSNFRRAWKEGARAPNSAKESGPKRQRPSVTPPTRRDSPKPPVGLLRLLLRSSRGRRLALLSLLVLGIAYTAASLASLLFGSSGLRSKAVAFLVFFMLGCVPLAASWLLHRAKRQASARPDR